MKLPAFNLKDKFRKDRISVGMDIGTSAIKTVKLKFSKDSFELCSFNLEPAQIDLGPVLKKIGSSCDTKRINLSISGPSTIIRYVDFPQMNAGELKQALRFEAEKYIPFSIPDVNLDSHILKPDLPNNKMLILLAAVKKESLNQRLKLIEDANLQANLIDLDSLALINAFNFNYAGDDNLKAKTIALLNIGAHLSNLNILENAIPRLSRDIQIAGNNFTQKLQDTLSIDFKSAEELKLHPDKERLDKITVALESALSGLAREVRASFDYYESQSTANVAKIFLSGGGSLFAGLKDMLVNLLGMEVEYWDPLKKISIPESIDSQKVKALSAQLAVAVGLALRE